MSTTLHEAFADLASAVEETDLAPRVHAGVRRRRQRRVVGVAAATGLLGLVALAVVVRPADKPSGITTVPTVTPSPVRVVAEPLYDVVWFGPAGKAWGLHGMRPDGTQEVAAPYCSLCAGGDVSPDGSRWAGFDARGLHVVSLRGGTSRLQYPVEAMGEQGFVPDVTWAPDNRTVAVVDFAAFDGATGVSGGFFLVDTSTGEVTRVAYRHRNFGLAWTPDGTRIAVVSPTGTVDVLTRTGTRVQRIELASFARLPRHAFSPDGTRLLVALEDTTAVVSFPAGQVTGRLRTANPYVWRDATHVACACTEGVVTEHRLDGTVTRNLVTITGEGRGHVLVRPAS